MTFFFVFLDWFLNQFFFLSLRYCKASFLENFQLDLLVLVLCFFSYLIFIYFNNVRGNLLKIYTAPPLFCTLDLVNHLQDRRLNVTWVLPFTKHVILWRKQTYKTLERMPCPKAGVNMRERRATWDMKDDCKLASDF